MKWLTLLHILLWEAIALARLTLETVVGENHRREDAREQREAARFQRPSPFARARSGITFQRRRARDVPVARGARRPSFAFRRVRVGALTRVRSFSFRYPLKRVPSLHSALSAASLFSRLNTLASFQNSSRSASDASRVLSVQPPRRVSLLALPPLLNLRARDPHTATTTMLTLTS